MQRTSIFLFALLTIIVLLMQYDLLGPALEVGFTPDDWSFVFWYKVLGPHPFSKIAEVWTARGPYTTVPLYYTGIINSIVGFDFQKMQMISILLKILATLALFPLVLSVFKNKLLGFLAVVLFAMSYSSTGALETAVEPSEYLGMFSMCLFLMIYNHIVRNNLVTWRWLILTVISLIITILLSVMRTYPLLVLIPIVEAYLLIQKQSTATLRVAVLRISSLFLPFILVTLMRPGVILPYIGTVPSVFLKILEGNWHLGLVPIQGIGHILPLSQFWKIFGSFELGSFSDYLFFIFGGPIVIFSLIILLLAFFTSSKPWGFLILSFTLNIFLEILVFFIATYSLSISFEQRMNFDSPRIYSTVLGLYVLSLAFVYWIEWQTRDRTNNLLLALWIGPAVSFLFIFLTWMLSDINLGFGGAQDHYLLIPTAAISIFVAAILVLIIQKLKFNRSMRFRSASLLMVIITLIGFYYLNKRLIHSYFKNVNANGGRAAHGQIMIQTRFREKIKDIGLKNPALFYFDTSQLSGDGPFYTEGLLSSLPFFMHFEGDELIDGCFEVFYQEKSKLAALIVKKNGERGFVYRSLCVESGRGGYREIFHKEENFYAFKLKDKNLFDIKKDLLKELDF